MNYGYGNMSQLLRLLHKAGGSAIDQASYTVDSAGNRTAKTDNLAAATSNYSFDAIYELTSVLRGRNTKGARTIRWHMLRACAPREAQLALYQPAQPRFHRCSRRFRRAGPLLRSSQGNREQE